MNNKQGQGTVGRSKCGKGDPPECSETFYHMCAHEGTLEFQEPILCRVKALMEVSRLFFAHETGDLVRGG